MGAIAPEPDSPRVQLPSHAPLLLEVDAGPLGRIQHPIVVPDANAGEVGRRRWPHRAVQDLAGRQEGLVSHRQLRRLGISKSAIGRAVRCGMLFPVFRGVYSVLPLSALPPLARERGAILACRPNAFLSHHSAAALWALRAPPEPDVEVTIVGRDGGRSRSGLRIHKANALDRRDTRMHRGLPVTAPARTLLDLAKVLSNRDLERAFDEALARHVMRRSEVLSMLERHPGRAGVGSIRTLIDADRATTMTRSEAEEIFLGLIRRADLPAPEVNSELEGLEVDFLWREERIVVEIDGHAFHSSRRALERDHSRDARLQAAGILVLRFTWRQLRHQPELVLARLVMALARRRAVA